MQARLERKSATIKRSWKRRWNKEGIAGVIIMVSNEIIINQ